MIKFTRVVLILSILCFYGCIRTSQEGTQDTTTETTTKTTQIREEYHDGKILALKTDTIEQSISKEQAQWESTRSTSINTPIGGILGSLASGGVLGGGPLMDIGSALLTIFGGKKIYDKVRDAPPRRPAPIPTLAEQKIVRREEEEL